MPEKFTPLMKPILKSEVSKPSSGSLWMLQAVPLLDTEYLQNVMSERVSLPCVWHSDISKNFRFIADEYNASVLAAQQFLREYGNDFKFNITQVIGLTNEDEVSKEFRPYKQMIERLNRTYKTSYRPTNGFDNIDGANYELALWVTYYNFLRPHKHNNYKVLNDIEMLHGANNMPGKWQLLIFLGQQTILNLQYGEAANCS